MGQPYYNINLEEGNIISIQYYVVFCFKFLQCLLESLNIPANTFHYISVQNYLNRPSQ